MIKLDRLAVPVSLCLLAVSNIATGTDGFNKGGRTALQFTKIGVGARQAGMGEASIAAVTDINGVFWNPASITGIGASEASFSYTKWIADLNYLAGSAGIRLSWLGILAVSAASLDYGDIREALISEAGAASDTRTGRTFTGSDILVGLSYARKVTSNLSLGLSVKYLAETLFRYAVDTYVFDVGSHYLVGAKGIRLAMSAQNFAFQGVKWLGENSDRPDGYDIPLIYRIGTAFNVVHPGDGFVHLGNTHRLQVSFDALYTNDYGERYHIGGEYLLRDFLALRGGYKFNYEEGNLALGFGLNQQLLGVRLTVDYAYVGFEFLNSPQRLTVLFSF